MLSYKYGFRAFGFRTFIYALFCLRERSVRLFSQSNINLIQFRYVALKRQPRLLGPTSGFDLDQREHPPFWRESQ